MRKIASTIRLLALTFWTVQLLAALVVGRVAAAYYLSGPHCRRPARRGPSHLLQPQRQRTTFSPPPPHGRSGAAVPLRSTFFDDLRKFFEGSGDARGGDNDDENDDDVLAAGTYRVATIPAQSVKPGGLRLFLMFYLMGQQNTPDQNSWRAHQPTTDDYVVDFWYHDQSAVLTITLTDKQIVIDRTGSNPSTSYLMQETVVVQGILDELQQCAMDESVAEEHRLLLLPEPKDAIDRARDSLAFA